MGLKNYAATIKPFRVILEQYDVALDNIEQRSLQNMSLISSGAGVWPVGPYQSYCTLGEAVAIESLLRRELDHQYALELTAAFEAKIVYYFRHHVKRGSVARTAFRDAVPAMVFQNLKPMMFGHVIDIFKSLIYPSDPITYADNCNLMDYRNWLAHGRAWDLNKNILSKFDFLYTLDVINSTMDHLPSFPSALRD